MRKSKLLLLVLGVISPLIFMGCPNGIEPFLPLQNQEVRMTVSDYGSWDSKDASGVINGNNFQIQAPVKGESGQDTIVLTLVIPIRTATPYTINVASDPNAHIEYCVQPISGACTDYVVSNGVGSGSITVSSVTQNGMSQTVEGTFNASPVAPNGDSKRITNGEFKVTIY